MNGSYTAGEVIRYAREQDVSFVRLAFCDIFGQLKNMSPSNITKVPKKTFSPMLVFPSRAERPSESLVRPVLRNQH